jgi:hypothetical protein
MSNMNWLRTLQVAAVVVSGAACAGPRMVAPPDVANGAQVLETKDRSAASGMLVDESFTLGKYSVNAVDRDATSKSSFSIGGYGKSSTTTGYTYQFVSDGDKINGGCGSVSKKQTVSLGAGSAVDWGNTQVTCECGEGAKLELVGKGDTVTGTASLGEEHYVLTPVEETDKSSFAAGPSGFRLDLDGKPQGAVETLHPGRVWLSKGVEGSRADQLSCLFVGLMLYVPPRED